MSKDGALWKQRYERLKQFIEDAHIEIENSDLEVSTTRAWDPPQILYVSFSYEVCDNEEHARETFGEGNYDVYRLERKGRDA